MIIPIKVKLSYVSTNFKRKKISISEIENEIVNNNF